MEVVLHLPGHLAKLPENERERLLRAGLREAVYARVRELENELSEAEARLAEYEKRYHMSLARFEEDILPTIDTYQEHEYYNDWFFWQSVADRNRLLLGQLRA